MKPVNIIVGMASIIQLARGNAVELENATLYAADDLLHDMQRIGSLLRECVAILEGSDGDAGEFNYSGGSTDEQQFELAAKIRAAQGDGA